MKNPTLAVIAFPGNNCETETARAAERNGFDATILRWNQVEEATGFDAYILPGGFSFEDRGRSGSIAAREPIFDKLRAEAQAGKLILGICNGAQMIVESGLIPIEDDPLPLSLAENVRRDTSDHVLGTGYYNVWCRIKIARKDTAFTGGDQSVLKVPVAHGEGRFTTHKSNVLANLATDEHVAFRYCDEAGNISSDYPTTPNGAHEAVAMIVNKEGTIGAIMPHPERFYTSTDGDQILASMYEWVQAGRSPSSVEIGDLSTQPYPEVQRFESKSGTAYFEKSLMITDNENFSVKSTAENILGKKITLHKSVVYGIKASEKVMKKLVESGIIYNPNKEQFEKYQPKPDQFLVKNFEDDAALHLAELLTEYAGETVEIEMLKGWDFSGTASAEDVEKILKNGLLCNSNAGALYMAYPDFY